MLGKDKMQSCRSLFLYLSSCLLCLLPLSFVGQAKPHVETPQADRIVLLTYDSPVPGGLMAGGPGTLKVINGCIRVAGTTVVFPSSFSYRIIKGKLKLIYQGRVYAREGDRIMLGGFPAGPSAPGNEKILGDVSRCPEPFWFR